jgi:hypothetical protein
MVFNLAGTGPALVSLDRKVIPVKELLKAPSFGMDIEDGKDEVS